MLDISMIFWCKYLYCLVNRHYFVCHMLPDTVCNRMETPSLPDIAVL